MQHTQAPVKQTSQPSPGIVLWLWRWFWRVTLVISLGYTWFCFYAPSNNIAWATNYASAQQQAAESGKPMILYFTGDWCVPCRIMKRQVWADEQVAARVNAQFIPVAIDVGNPDEATVLARYSVIGSPVTMITDPKGNVMQWREGGMGKADFVAWLEKLSP